jgi:hypothetical protein
MDLNTGFSIRALEENDYDDILFNWWKDWGFTPPSKSFLPEDAKGGMIVYDGDVPVCAGFLYITNSKVALVNWIVSNKQYRKKPNRRIAIDLLIQSLTNTAKSLGYEYSHVLIKNSALESTYERLGYTKSITYTNELIKKL